MTEPAFRVVKGEPTDEELAALVVAIRMRARPAGGKPEPASGWSRREDLLRKPLHPGPDAWRRGG